MKLFHYYLPGLGADGCVIICAHNESEADSELMKNEYYKSLSDPQLEEVELITSMDIPQYETKTLYWSTGKATKRSSEYDVTLMFQSGVIEQYVNELEKLRDVLDPEKFSYIFELLDVFLSMRQHKEEQEIDEVVEKFKSDGTVIRFPAKE